MVSYDTPLEAIETLRRRMEDYISDDKMRREWSNATVNIDKMEFQNAIHLTIGMEHKPNWQDWGGRWARRTAFMRHLKTVLEELDIRYTMPVQPVLMPNPPYPTSADLRSPYSGSPRMGNPMLRVQTRSPGASTEGLGMQFNNSRESLGNAGSFRGGDVARAPSRSLRPGPDRF